MLVIPCLEISALPRFKREQHDDQLLNEGWATSKKGERHAWLSYLILQIVLGTALPRFCGNKTLLCEFCQSFALVQSQGP